MKKILVLDDELEIDFIFKTMFEQEIDEHKLEIDYYSDPKKCLADLEENSAKKYDYIFSDINMPVINGVQFVRELRSHFYMGPIAFISAYSKLEYLKEMSELDIKLFIEKPINFKDIKSMLNL